MYRTGSQFNHYIVVDLRVSSTSSACRRLFERFHHCHGAFLTSGSGQLPSSIDLSTCIFQDPDFRILTRDAGN